jgi:hypothetical protein
MIRNTTDALLETRIPAGERHRTGPRKRRPSCGISLVGPSLTVCVVVSQADQEAREGITGTKTQTDESGGAVTACVLLLTLQRLMAILTKHESEVGVCTEILSVRRLTQGHPRATRFIDDAL